MPPCSILVVDDEPALLKMVVTFLDGEGYAVQGVSTGQEALSLLEREPAPVVLVLDMNLPDMTGWQVVQELRARGCSSKILVITTIGEARKVARRMQADGFLGKPFALLQLLRAVERLCSKGA